MDIQKIKKASDTAIRYVCLALTIALVVGGFFNFGMMLFAPFTFLLSQSIE